MRINSFDFIFDLDRGDILPTEFRVNYTVETTDDRGEWLLDVVEGLSTGMRIVEKHIPPPDGPIWRIPESIKKENWEPGYPIGPPLKVEPDAPIGHTANHTFTHQFNRQDLCVYTEHNDICIMQVKLVPMGPPPSNIMRHVEYDVNISCHLD